MAIPNYNIFGARARPAAASVSGGGSAYGGVPILPSSSALQGNMTNILNSAIPGYSGLTQSASGIIGDAMAGKLPPDVRNLIQDSAATQAVMSGMPGSNTTSGTLMGNRSLRDLGITSLQRQDKGVSDFIGFLQGVSGTAAPTFGQSQEQENAIAKYASAPDPSAAAAEQQRLYEKYANPAAGTFGGGGGGIGSGSSLPWYMQGDTFRRPGAAGGGAGSGPWIKQS